MSLYLISYDLHRKRDYPKLYEALEYWHSTRLLESVWLAELAGPASAIRDILQGYIDGDDSLAVIELGPRIEWATILVEPAGGDWLLRHIPVYD